MNEAPESVKYHKGFDPANPPQGEAWCEVCSNWDDDCSCEYEPEIQFAPYPDKNLPFMARCSIEGHSIYGFGPTQELAESRVREHLAAYWMAKAKLAKEDK